jgi:hypothetical protein
MMVLFQCNNPDCTNEIKKFFKKSADIPPFLDCGECGTGKLERTLGSPSTKSTQIIDNGSQARQVEIDNNVVEKERERLYNE